MRAIPGVPRADGALADFLAAHAHSFSRAELVAHWPERHIAAAVSAGSLVRLLPGVYCGASHRAEPVVVGEALNLWHPPGLVTGELALALFAERRTTTGRTAVVVAHGQHLRAPGGVRLLQAGPVRVSGSAGGVRCTVPERALLDAWRLAPPSRRVDVFWDTLWARTCTWRHVRNELARTSRLPARPDLERLLGWFAAGATTPLEVRARDDIFAGPLFRAFEWQVAVECGGRRWVVDMLHRASGVVVELDGDRYHATRMARDSDRRRQTELVAAGFTVLRFGWRDVVERPEWCRDTVLATTARSRPPRRSA